jgi:SAM-dependent methyltransferase
MIEREIADHTADRDNALFWETLCGSSLARALGATDFTLRSLAIFDTYFMAYYSYVYDWLPLTQLAGKDVLEIGLGYGTIGQLLAAARCRYTGLDVARAPVELLNHRLALVGLPGGAQTGSILEAPFDDASFDYVVTFGCLHHTGDIQRAMNEIARLLRTTGQLIMMVYYSYSYRMWYQRRHRLFADLFKDIAGGTVYIGQDSERALYDTDSSGAAAPHTVFTSKRQLRRLASRSGLSIVRVGTENAAQEPPFSRVSRERLLKTWAKLIGGDLYAVLEKR